MVKARWEGNPLLGLSIPEKLHFHVTSKSHWATIHHGFSDAEIDILRALAKQGMDVSMRFSGREICNRFG